MSSPLSIDLNFIPARKVTAFATSGLFESSVLKQKDRQTLIVVGRLTNALKFDLFNIVQDVEQFNRE